MNLHLIEFSSFAGFLGKVSLLQLGNIKKVTSSLSLVFLVECLGHWSCLTIIMAEGKTPRIIEDRNQSPNLLGLGSVLSIHIFEIK